MPRCLHPVHNRATKIRATLRKEIYPVRHGFLLFIRQFCARVIRDLPGDIISMKAGINVANDATYRERTFVPCCMAAWTSREGHPRDACRSGDPIVVPAAEEQRPVAPVSG